MRCIVMILCAVLMLDASLLAQPATQPATQPVVPMFRGARRGMAPMVVPGPAPARALGPAEVEQVWSWTRQNMPSLAKLMGDFPPRSPGRMRLMSFALVRMQNEQFARDEALKDRFQKNIRQEDAIFEMAFDFRHASPEQRREIAGRIADRVKQVIDENFAQREENLENLRKRLAEETQRLADDKANRESIVEARLRMFVPAAAGEQPAQENNAFDQQQQ